MEEEDVGRLLECALFGQPSAELERQAPDRGERREQEEVTVFAIGHERPGRPQRPPEERHEEPAKAEPAS